MTDRTSNLVGGVSEVHDRAGDELLETQRKKKSDKGGRKHHETDDPQISLEPLADEAQIRANQNGADNLAVKGDLMK